MSFDLAWLDLREPADHAARDGALLRRAQAYLAATERPMVVDLGAGSAATVRAFGDRPLARWRLVDSDPVLLGAAARRSGPDVVLVHADLRDLDGLPLSDARLVTASALLDLVSAAWIAGIADRVTALGAGFYAALNYDGHMVFTPADPDDEAIVAAFNQHQRSDKGFGPALGPSGGEWLAEAMRSKGYGVWTAESPWRLGAGDAALQDRLVAGIAAAAAEAGSSVAEGWRQRRTAALPESACVVGHLDVLALPGG